MSLLKLMTEILTRTWVNLAKQEAVVRIVRRDEHGCIDEAASLPITKVTYMAEFLVEETDIYWEKLK